MSNSRNLDRIMSAAAALSNTGGDYQANPKAILQLLIELAEVCYDLDSQVEELTPDA